MYKTLTTALRALEMHSPFGGWRHHLSPASGGTITRAYCRDIYEESDSRCFILSPEWGKVRRSRIGGGERSEPICRMRIKPYDTESQSRNADFISIAAERQSATLSPSGLSPPERSEHNPPPTGGHNLRPGGPSTFSFTTLLHNLRRSRAPFFKSAAKPPPQPSA